MVTAMSGSQTSVVVDPQDGADIGIESAILVTLRGHNLGKRIGLEPEISSLTIGRDDDAGLCLNDDSVSRFHCEIVFIETGWFITDLGSTNGTYVSGHSVDRAPLRDGDLVKVGATIFKFLSTENIEAAFHEEIYRLAIIDGLTQVYNRRYLEEFLDREMSRCRRHGRPMCVIMFDIDNFKQINDQFGHLSGDYVFRSIADKLKRRIRHEELLARYGGDEFMIILPETDLDDAVKFGEIIRQSVDILPLSFDGWKIPVTVSLGVGRYDHKMTQVSELIAIADSALYRAKSNGRNQVSS